MRSAGTDLAESGRVRVWWLALLLALALTRPAAAAPVVVRFPESASHGFLVLRGANGDVLAHGEFVQAPAKGQRMESRLVFRFRASTDVTFGSRQRPLPGQGRRQDRRGQDRAARRSPQRDHGNV